MLAHTHRLTDSQSFAHVRREGRVVPHPLVLCAVLARPNQATRVGFVVSKRVGTAVVRNRVKRVLRAVVRAELPAIAMGYDIVFTARPVAATASFTDVRTCVQRALRRHQMVAWQTPVKGGENA